MSIDNVVNENSTSPTPSIHDDEKIFWQLLDGEIDVEQAYQQIESNGGFPIETDRNSFIFVLHHEDDGWNLAGDHEAWQGQPMNKQRDIHWLELSIESPQNMKYKFRRGDDWIADPWARSYNYDEHGEISYIRANEKHIERFDNFMRDRRIRVWVPEDRNFDRVLYIHDGQNIYDPHAMWGGWRLQNSLPDGILAVAIDNNSERIHEYTHTSDIIDGQEIGGAADEYLRRIESELRPRIEEIYGPTAITGVLGSSLGGLLAFYSIHRYPDVYDMAISLSGTMGWGSFALNNQTMIDIFKEAGKQNHYLYLDSGGWGACQDNDDDGIMDDGEGADNYCTNIQFRDVLVELGYEMGENLWHWYEPEAPHNEAAWATRVWRSLEHFSTLDTGKKR